MDVLCTIFCRVLNRTSRIYDESYQITEQQLQGHPIEELDAFAAQLNGPNGGYPSLKSNNDIRLAGQLSALSWCYLDYRQRNSGIDVRGLQGQELQERAYELLRKRLGKTHVRTVQALSDLTCWDISFDQRQKYLEEAINRVKKEKPRCPEDLWMMFKLFQCCMRNNDHGDNIKALLQHLGDLDENLCGRWFLHLIKIGLHYVQIRQKDWDATDQFDLEPMIVQGEYPSKLWLPKNRSTLEDLNILLGTLDRVERALIKGVVFETSWNTSYRPFAELLVRIYLGQGEPGLKKAEEWLHLMIIDNESCRIQKLENRIPRLSFPQVRELASKLATVRNWEGLLTHEHEHVLLLFCFYRYKYQLADVYARQQRYAEARPLLEEVVDANLHKKNPIHDPCRELLITVYLELGEPKKAKPLQEAVVEDIAETFGEGSKELLPALRLLSKIYRMNGQWPKKNEVDLRILRYRE